MALMTTKRRTVERAELDPMARQIGERIAMSRKAAGFATQDDLAKAIHVVPSTVARWEKGLRVPRFQQQITLCRTLGQSHEFLFGFVVARAS
ncbi:MAG: Helix-turn-helix domain [Acidimicrobiaceae bacterium]|nr:Helix-turn-helix domain [Acidimicrobiaceae bacterium]